MSAFHGGDDDRRESRMREHRRAAWPVFALGILVIAAVVVAFLVVGPASPSAGAQSRVVTVSQGVVQSTVSGSGNLEPAVQLDLGFKTSGVVEHIYVNAGQHVTPGQLIAELNPKSAEVSLEQAKATAQSASAALLREEETGGETSSGSASGGSASGGQPTASAAAHSPAKSSPQRKSSAGSGSGGKSSSSSSTSSSSQGTRQSAATREANLASARAAVRSDKLAVENDEQAVSNTKLYAPTSGTIVSLAGEVGETVSGTGTTRAQASSAGAGSSGSGSGSAGRGGANNGASSSSSSSSSSNSAFAVLSDLSAMQLVVALSESEIAHVHVGQPATATVEALEGLKLAAHVVSVATLATSSNGVVSYNVTFALDQTGSGLKPGMSASAEVIVKQEEGVNVPTSAIAGGSVTVVEHGKQTRRRVVTGLAGNSSTIILSGLKDGEQIALPLTSSSSATSILSRLGGRGGGLRGGGLGGALGGGGGPPVVFRGGG
jgi:multidrug efflux pump subunit AcrA (membrane-fusion protein)